MTEGKTKRRIQGMVFDMDGTLLDTERQYIDGYFETAKKRGMDLPKWLPYKCMGLPRPKVRENYKNVFGNDFDFDAFRAEVMDGVHLNWEKNGIPVKRGVKEFLEYCKKEGIPCAVATSTSKESAYAMLKTAGLYEYFDSVVYGDEIEKGKPSPDIFLEGARRIGVDPKNCGGVEDSRSGITAVNRAGMTAFFMLDTIEADEEIKNLAEYICEEMNQVMEIVKSLNETL